MRLLIFAGLLVAIFHWLGEVSYDTHPGADTPSRPTQLPLNEADQALKNGAEWAKSNRVDSHRACKAVLPPMERLGCSRYVTEQKHIPPLTGDQLHLATTRYCEDAVRAHYEPLIQDLHERGDTHAAYVTEVRDFKPDMEVCNNIDNLRIIKVIHEPLVRIEDMLNRARAEQPLSQDELLQLRRDYPLVDGFRMDERRTRYLEIADELFNRIGGRERVFPLAPPGMSQAARDGKCIALAQHMADNKKAFHEAVAALTLATQRGASKSEQSTIVARQNQHLDAWAQTADDLLKVGCPPLR
jgi:hypothetical protein